MSLNQGDDPDMRIFATNRGEVLFPESEDEQMEFQQLYTERHASSSSKCVMM